MVNEPSLLTATNWVSSFAVFFTVRCRFGTGLFVVVTIFPDKALSEIWAEAAFEGETLSRRAIRTSLFFISPPDTLLGRGLLPCLSFQTRRASPPPPGIRPRSHP